ncbi:3-oxoacyl-ACP synthase [Aestuariivirga litoralis]|uniref:Beta-ketoacyl-[acyl-carrier-protein] synthase III n=1 Tax=Aestuariivirga litoralis TaxID=2650924 RepID=A0A2W2BKB6_9HYPH|nr:3-oxoacyl-ACP synthase [Aestuariivirga litoralis]
MNDQTKTVTRSVIAGCGSALPQRVMTNADLSKIVDTSDEWIVERTGIKSRYIAGEGETTRTLGTLAAKRALEHAGIAAEEVDLIILATATPDNTFPATATLVQYDLGITQGAAFDVQAVCSGFVYALSVADAMLKAGQAKCALVIGSETFSRILDWTDRGTCVLFGDGAGAVVLKAEQHPDVPESPGILVTRIRSDGRHSDKLYVDGGPSTTKTVGHLRMEGREVFKHAVTNIATVMDEAMKLAHVAPAEVDWFVPHQANRRILEGTAKKLGIREDRIVITLDRHGNTSAASIPLAFDVAVKDGRIRKGELVLFEAMGGGFTWGAVLARY